MRFLIIAIGIVFFGGVAMPIIGMFIYLIYCQVVEAIKRGISPFGFVFISLELCILLTVAIAVLNLAKNWSKHDE